MIHDYDDADVIDKDGQKLGPVERSYVDDRGDVRFVEVKIGTLRTKYRFIPVEDVDQTSAGLRVPYKAEVIEDSPDASSVEDTLAGDLLDRVRSYYADAAAVGAPHDDQAPAAVPANAEETDAGEGLGDKLRERLHAADAAGGDLLHRHDHGDDAPPTTGVATSSGVVDKGDVVDIPIVEERLVKQPVVTEVLRVRKTPQTEQRTAEADVQKEDVEVVEDGDAVVRDDTGKVK